MKWTQEDGYITTGGPLRASMKYNRLFDKYQVRVGGLSAQGSADTEEEAKKFGEEQLAIAKRAFILSLITQDGNAWRLGKNIVIVPSGELHALFVGEYGEFRGTLDDCKNYLVEWLW
jgi:hypothetical protein